MAKGVVIEAGIVWEGKWGCKEIRRAGAEGWEGGVNIQAWSWITGGRGGGLVWKEGQGSEEGRRCRVGRVGKGSTGGGGCRPGWGGKGSSGGNGTSGAREGARSGRMLRDGGDRHAAWWRKYTLFWGMPS